MSFFSLQSLEGPFFPCHPANELILLSDNTNRNVNIPNYLNGLKCLLFPCDYNTNDIYHIIGLGDKGGAAPNQPNVPQNIAAK